MLFNIICVQNYKISCIFHPILAEKCIFRQKYLEDSELVRIFAPTNLTTLPVDQRTRVRLFCFMSIDYEYIY